MSHPVLRGGNINLSHQCDLANCGTHVNGKRPGSQYMTWLYRFSFFILPDFKISTLFNVNQMLLPGQKNVIFCYVKQIRTKLPKKIQPA